MVTNTGNVEVIGFKETDIMLGHLMTQDYKMAGEMRKFIRKALKEARKQLQSDAKNYMKSDPRRASRAVKYAVYKSMFGGNISILQKGAGTHGKFSTYKPPRKLVPGQRGGNRRPYNETRSRLDKYQGADRGFILRFINAGTEQRQTIYGNRGRIPQSGWFGHTAPWHIQDAAAKVSEAIKEYIDKQ